MQFHHNLDAMIRNGYLFSQDHKSSDLFVPSQSKQVEGELMSFLDIARDLEESLARKQIEKQTGIAFDPSEYESPKEREVRFCIFNLILLQYLWRSQVVSYLCCL